MDSLLWGQQPHVQPLISSEECCSCDHMDIMDGEKKNKPQVLQMQCVHIDSDITDYIYVFELVNIVTYANI